MVYAAMAAVDGALRETWRPGRRLPSPARKGSGASRPPPRLVRIAAQAHKGRRSEVSGEGLPCRPVLAMTAIRRP